MDNGVVTPSARAARLDADLVSRFATCCQALGLAGVRPASARRYGRRAPGFHRAHPGRPRPVRRLDRAGRRRRRARWTCSQRCRTPSTTTRRTAAADGACRRGPGVPLRHGLYLQFRATTADDFQLAYAAALAIDGQFHTADEIVTEILRRAARTGARPAGSPSVIDYRAERWSDVVKLLTPIVNDTDLDEAVLPRRQDHPGHRAGPAGHVRPRAVLSRGARRARRGGRGRRRAGQGAGRCAPTVDEEAASEVLQDLYAAHPENEQVEQALSDPSFGIVTTTAARIDARTDPWDPETEPSRRGFRRPRSPASARPRCSTRPNASSPSSSAWTRSKTRCPG